MGIPVSRINKKKKEKKTDTRRLQIDERRQNIIYYIIIAMGQTRLLDNTRLFVNRRCYCHSSRMRADRNTPFPGAYFQ